MLFNSIQFLIFFPIVVLLYFLIPHKFRYVWLLFASYYFYMAQEPSYAVFLVLTTVITWTAGNLLYRAVNKFQKNIIVAAGFLLTLSFLLYFKYTDFFLSLFGSGRQLHLLLPLGISFYTFQSLTYIMDCYRQETPPEKNILKYALFVSFFPNILSGPIERSKNLLKQFEQVHAFDVTRVKEGLTLMLWGYFLKMVLVSRLAILTDLVYDHYNIYTGMPLIIATLSYTFQIYCDFAGYSSIAVGAARIMGFQIMQNFRQPYFAVSVSDFWHRWHISLSTWFRDYLYIPLGGSRCSKGRKYFNIAVVFLTSGFWHGANITFILWGALNGLYQIAGDMLRPFRTYLCSITSLTKHPVLHRILRTIFTFLLLSITWVFFRAPTITDAGIIMKKMFTTIDPADFINGTIFTLGLGTANLLFVVFSLLILLAADLLCEYRRCDISRLLIRTPVLLRWGIYYLLFTMILLSCNLSTQEFLYMQ
ncbi:MAG TPA: MBOAT family O-acyltransferase, partial [Lachnospiraceae bacterium]|nr:MBOAT family O-acyltransferase [Lachnospiraceae bacterium]